MRILLDNNVNKRFGRLIKDHEVIHAEHIGWANLRNGELLKAAEEAGYLAVITGDKQMQFQQNLIGRKLSVIILNSERITFEYISPLAGKVNIALDCLQSGKFIIINPDA